MLTIGILEGGAVAPEFSAHLTSFTDSFRNFLAPGGAGPLLRPYRCYAGEFPQRGDACDGWLITGSAASVYDGDDWIAQLEAFTRTAAEKRPVVGICFGHQLVAQAFGGTVAKAPGWGIGVHLHNMTHRTEWMHPPLASLSLLASHQDQVVTPPPGAQVLGGSDFCPIGVMTVGPNVLCIQNHPEMTREFAAELYDSRRDRMGSDTVDTALASLNQPTDEAATAAWILDFLSH
ncbi:MAG: gamma-glutamyl-gamma-aminobutyrate hydrolase family protein [Alphaproteobacteria bacterium]|jgi:GMP synthase (glutamine-hydrolysing)|nr:gamma-glutamyl-gamma-aminobutyrate hydrolase family protein [Alphaproteobacteria bacterium]